MVDGRDEAGSSLRRSPPWGFLGTVLIVLAIECAIGGHDLDFTTPMHWDWRVIGKAATRPDKVKGRDLLMFGDSLVKFSLMPAIFEEKAGKKAFNFALHTGQTSSSYFMLARTIRAGAKPSAILLDLTPHMFMQEPQTNQHLWADLLTPEECLDMASAMRDPSFFASILCAELFPSYKERHEIRAGLMAAIRGGSSSRRGEIPLFRRNWKVNDGAQLMGDSPAPAIDPHFWAKSLYPHWSPHPVNVAYLDRFLGLAASKDIPVYWLLPPIHPAVQSKTDESGFDASYSRFVGEVHRRFPGTIVVDARHSGFPADEFSDGAHLNRRGALKLSAALAEVFRKPIGESGHLNWVMLDRGRGGEIASLMEDIHQSAEYLRDVGKGVRR